MLRIAAENWSEYHADYKHTINGQPYLLQHGPKGSTLVPVRIVHMSAEHLASLEATGGEA